MKIVQIAFAVQGFVPWEGGEVSEGCYTSREIFSDMYCLSECGTLYKNVSTEESRVILEKIPIEFKDESGR